MTGQRPDTSHPVRVLASSAEICSSERTGILAAGLSHDESPSMGSICRRWLSAMAPGSAPQPEDTRRAHRHTSAAGLDWLEGRRLMATDPLDAPVAVLAQVATVNLPPQTPSSFGIAQDSFLATVLYSVPKRMASGIAADGAVGVNATWETGQTSSWFIEQQRYGADFVQAGLVTGNAALVQQGWQILDWGFNKEAADGSFLGTGDAFHSTSMFVEAGARALLLEVQSGAPDAAALVAKYLPKIDASAHWLMIPSVAAKGAANDAPYSHRRWLLADALGETAWLTGDPATAAAAEVYARQGLALQGADGMDPENGGGDSSYQAYGVLLAERYLTVCPDSDLRSQVQTMIVAALNWEEGFIDASGQVSIVGSTRTGTEVSRDNTVKTVDYKTIIQAFSVATTLTGDPSYRLVAQAVASGRGWSIT